MKDIRDATLIQGKVFELQRVIMEAHANAIEAREAILRKPIAYARLKQKWLNSKTGMLKRRIMNLSQLGRDRSLIC